jgi:salicylate hydroxylase
LSSKASQEILIVGGGIGGVASALALARRGIRSRVLEKAPEFGEIGYGIQQGPNAYRMLDWLGVMKDLEPQAVFTKNLILIDALTDRELTRVSCGDAFRKHFRAPYTVVHRRDLHGALLEACRKRDEISLHTSKELVSFEDRGASVVARFADGSEYEGQALLGADGLRSRVREIVIGDGAPRPAGHVTYRGVIGLDRVKESHFDDMVIWVGPGCTCPVPPARRHRHEQRRHRREPQIRERRARGLRRAGRARRSVLAHHAAGAGDARLRRQGQELGAARPRAPTWLDAR